MVEPNSFIEAFDIKIGMQVEYFKLTDISTFYIVLEKDQLYKYPIEMKFKYIGNSFLDVIPIEHLVTDLVNNMTGTFVADRLVKTVNGNSYRCHLSNIGFLNEKSPYDIEYNEIALTVTGLAGRIYN